MFYSSRVQPEIYMYKLFQLEIYNVFILITCFFNDALECLPVGCVSVVLVLTPLTNVTYCTKKVNGQLFAIYEQVWKGILFKSVNRLWKEDLESSW